MPEGRTVFAQLMDLVPRRAFERCVRRYGGNHRVRAFSGYDQFLCLAFVQLAYRASLRDIETCLRALRPKLYPAGLRGRGSRSPLADANEVRDGRISADFAQTLIRRARQLYCDGPCAVELAQTAYALDATTVNLRPALFPWASFRRHTAAAKLHTLLDLRAQIPTVVAITRGKAALASVMIMGPGGLLLDEPTAGLDPRSSRALLDVILEAGMRGKTVITATNDLHIVAEIATRVRVFGEDRRVLASGSVGEVLTNRPLPVSANLVHRHRPAHGNLCHEHVHEHPGDHPPETPHLPV